MTVQKDVHQLHYQISGKISLYIRKCFICKEYPFSIPYCDYHEAYTCAWWNIVPAFNEYILSPYPKTCNILQYSGEVEYDTEIEDKHEIYLAYNMAPPKTVTVHEEYLIYDTIGLIGSVGGTLGMFIGFSFSNAIGTFMKNIVRLKNKFFE